MGYRMRLHILHAGGRWTEGMYPLGICRVHLTRVKSWETLVLKRNFLFACLQLPPLDQHQPTPYAITLPTTISTTPFTGINNLSAEAQIAPRSSSTEVRGTVILA